MHPILLRIPLPGVGYFDIASYGVMLALGTLAGVFVAMRLTRREGLSADLVIDLGFWTVIAGVLGAKLWFVIQNWNLVADRMDLLRSFRSGLVFYGGVIGAAIVVTWFAKVKRMPVTQMLDVAAPAAMLGLAFGRIGCFLNGCCWGKPTTSWFGVRFGQIVEDNHIVGSLPYFDQLNRGLIKTGDTLTTPVVPTQLIECAGALAVFALLLVARRSRKYFGEQVTLMLMLYGVVRLSVEFFRGDGNPTIGALSLAQIFSIAMIVLGIAGLAYLRKARPARLLVPDMATAGASANDAKQVKSAGVK